MGNPPLPRARAHGEDAHADGAWPLARGPRLSAHWRAAVGVRLAASLQARRRRMEVEPMPNQLEKMASKTNAMKGAIE